MQYSTEFKYIDQYEYASVNQHGCRYKKATQKQVRVVVLKANTDNCHDLRELILFSDKLQVPVRYNWDSSPQTAYIKLVSA